ncbi:cytoplasmic dynein 2 light intermediate chain 1 [Prorops nasuta]|uniref:cytoplasmic dynein 2 light intermediate chain 1 n=1 Tax=Prorops nasuta TaxID=863751 RepID=UPI0034CF1E72
MSVEAAEENLREMAFQKIMEEENKRKTDPNETHERSLIILGSKGVGKTTMIHRFLEKDDTPKPTIAIDYSFARKSGKSLAKNIVHVWEIGYTSSSLITAAIAGSSLKHSPHHTTLFIMLDLAKPETLWLDLEKIISAVESALKTSYDAKIINEMKERKLRDIKKEPGMVVDPFPIRACIIGGRYDEFKEFDADKKELIGKILRAVAHSLCAGLYYHSSKDKILVRRTRDMLSQYGFGNHSTEIKCMDYDKPLAISAGADTFSLIDLNLPRAITTTNLDSIKDIFLAHIPQEEISDSAFSEDPSNDPNFSESIIDKLRTQREQIISVSLTDMLEGQPEAIPVPDPF